MLPKNDSSLPDVCGWCCFQKELWTAPCERLAFPKTHICTSDVRELGVVAQTLPRPSSCLKNRFSDVLCVALVALRRCCLYACYRGLKENMHRRVLQNTFGEASMSRDGVSGLTIGVYKRPLRPYSFSLIPLSISNYSKLTPKSRMSFRFSKSVASDDMWKDPVLPKIPVRFLMSLLRSKQSRTSHPCVETSAGLPKHHHTSLHARIWGRG